MILLAIAVLSLLAVVNYYVCQRSLYPPVVFCSIWAADLLLVRLAGGFFYPITGKTLTILTSGAFAFSLGAVLAVLVHSQPTIEQSFSKSSNRLLNILFFVVVVSSPFVIRWVVETASSFDVASVLLAARMAMLEADESGDPSGTLYGNVVTLAYIVAMIAFAQRRNGKKRAVITIAIALLLSIARGSRAEIVLLLLSIICLDSMSHNRFRWKPLFIVSISLLLITAALAIAVQKGDARVDASLEDNLRPVMEGLVAYGAGGIVAFDRVVREPNIIPHNWQASTGILLLANKVGAGFDVPSLRADFVNIGQGDLTQNVYTIYFAYYDLGSVGMMMCIAAAGFIATIFYQRAIAGNKIAIIAYSYCFAAILLSPFADYFFMSLNFPVKLIIVAWIVYKLPSTAIELCKFLSMKRATSAKRPSLLSP